MKLRNPMKGGHRHDRLAHDFDRLHSLGAQRFGATWLRVNQTVVEAALPYADVEHPVVKVLLSAIAFAICARELGNERNL